MRAAYLKGNVYSATARLYEGQAREKLKHKTFVSARWLARKLGLTPPTAGRILAFLPEWQKYNNRMWRRVE